MAQQQGPGVPPAAGQPQAGDKEKEARTWAMICHLAALAGFVIPFGNIIGPLIVWLIKKDEFPFVNDQGKESLNFQISVAIAAIIALVLCFFCIGVPLLIAIGLANIVFIVIAAIKANDGVAYRYPVAIRFLK